LGREGDSGIDLAVHTAMKLEPLSTRDLGTVVSGVPRAERKFNEQKHQA
jgi:hypothetical protein